ncbi:hypothetical protein PC119_g28610 [Phytophthora cactorum]|nr:hypothetical protein PC119_g28610 [Phytophthora cactorum]
MPVILAVGTFEGELNDLMFGIVNPTQEIMRVKASRRTFPFRVRQVDTDQPAT